MICPGRASKSPSAIAITPIPNLLLLDEPVSGIDRKGMDLFYKNIQKLKENYDLAMIVVSHDFEFVRQYADHVILLDKTIKKKEPLKRFANVRNLKSIWERYR